MLTTKMLTVVLCAVLALAAAPCLVRAQNGQGATPQIAEEAFIYGFPMVMNYGVMNEYFNDKSSSQYKCPFNELSNTAHVYTPADTAVVTHNSDTPYSFFCADLRAEPVVFNDKQSNWLPAPDGPIYLAMRRYWPKTEPPSVLPPGNGTWKPPAVVKAK